MPTKIRSCVFASALLVALAVTLLSLSSVSPAAADSHTVSSLLGDKDGFGFGLKEGDRRPVPFSFDNREPDDPFFTDVEPIASSFSYTHTFVLGDRTIAAAELRMLTAGIQDGDTQVVGSDTDVRLFLDNVEVPNAFDDVDQFDFFSGVGFAEIVGSVTIEIPENLLTLLSDGEIVVRVQVLQLGTAPSTDAFAMDFSELIIAAETQGKLVGTLPASGFGLVTFSGTIEQLRDALAIACPSGKPIFATSGGEFVGFFPTAAIAAVNAQFNARFPGGVIPSGTPLIGGNCG